MATKKKAPTRKSPAKRATFKPLAIQVNTTTQIEAAEGADFRAAAGAVLTDLQRRLSKGELTGLEVKAYGMNGNRILAEL